MGSRLALLHFTLFAPKNKNTGKRETVSYRLVTENWEFSLNNQNDKLTPVPIRRGL